jgi:hypothetical protein
VFWQKFSLHGSEQGKKNAPHFCGAFWLAPLFFGGGANEVIALSLRGGFIAEAISLMVEGIASVAIVPSQ